MEEQKINKTTGELDDSVLDLVSGGTWGGQGYNEVEQVEKTLTKSKEPNQWHRYNTSLPGIEEWGYTKE